MDAKEIAELYEDLKKDNVWAHNLEMEIIRYAKEKCAEQRKLCNETMSFMEHGDSKFKDYGLEQNSPEPEFK